MDSIIGQTILGYTIVEKIGSGGFGDVYRAERNNIVGNSVRALKIITLPKENEYIEILNAMGGDKKKADEYFKKELDRVVNEIRVFSLISEKDNHNIVSYYENDVKQTGNFGYNIYILMELLTPLNIWLQNNNITVGDVINIGIDISRGLSICHKNRIIHRDIKLSNIFVSKDGTYKLGDFGVSKRINDSTLANTLKGTPNYIAPEIYMGESQYDKSVDIYSLGIVLYYLFNKKRFPYYPNFPEEFTNEDADKAFYKRMKYEKLETPVCAPECVAEIIKTAISKPEERYKDADVLANALQEAKAGLSETELNEKIGFEPVLKEKAGNSKEQMLMKNLIDGNCESISFEKYNLTDDIKEVPEIRKKIIVILVTLLLLGSFLVYYGFIHRNIKPVEHSTTIPAETSVSRTSIPEETTVMEETVETTENSTTKKATNKKKRKKKIADSVETTTEYFQYNDNTYYQPQTKSVNEEKISENNNDSKTNNNPGDLNFEDVVE